MFAGENYEECSLTKPTSLSGKACIGPGNFDAYYINNCSGEETFYAGNIVKWTCNNTAERELSTIVWQNGIITCFNTYLSGFNPGDKIINTATGSIVPGAFLLESVECDYGQLHNTSLTWN
jgi:hypothetical protein